MIYIKKFLPLFISLIVVFSSAYAFISSAKSPDAVMQDVKKADTPTDTVKKFPLKKYSLNTFDDLNTVYPMDTKQPENIKSVVEYDPKTGNYIFRTYAGNMEITTPYLMTEQEYRNYSAKKELETYWKEKNASGTVNNEDKFSISDMKFNIGPADKVFGPGGVQVKTQGSAELVFGVKQNRIDNPALTEQMRSSIVPEFDMKIQMNVTGSVGDKVNFGMNYNTESTFDFDQKMVKLAYKGKEDDIIKNIQAGNVSMQLNSSLISGSTALFGIKTDLQFGKLSVSAIASQQESETKTVSSKGGAQTTEFEVNADDYDENRHFFLSHYFREKYEQWMANIPNVTSGIEINRVEVWVTNKRASYDQSRNVVAFMDLGEAQRIEKKALWSKTSTNDYPQNKSNDLYSRVKAVANSRDIQLTNSVLTDAFGSNLFIGGEDFEKIESARKLDPAEYTLNKSLGTISLKSALNPDEVLGVAYEYTSGGEVYQVGEFSTDDVDAPDALFIKLLKSTAQTPQLALWDLMMKNVYYLGAMQIQSDNFELNIVYRNDSVGTDMQYLNEGAKKNQLLLKVMNLDRLDVKNNPVSDGKFDYVEGLTALSSSGRIIFPVLEPFGNHIAKSIDPSFNPANPSELVKKYYFPELYDSTLVVAQELSEKNKFKIVGEYKASSGSEIRLNAMNVPRGSVTVTAGGATLTENVDYTVDYTMGTVTILNQSIIESGTNIDVKLENQSTFSMQRKSLVGTHLEYQFNKDFSLGGTVMHLSEIPLTTKVNTGSEPISNTIWGLNTAWRAESQWITNMLDKLPFVNATKPSTIALNAEFAQLIPGHSKVVGSQGLAYLDDFESTKTSIDIHYPVNWYLASTPQLFSESKSSTVEYGKNRALLSWYYVDQILNSVNPGRTTPVNLRNNAESQSNHYTRDVKIKEVFPNKSYALTERSLLTVMNLSYYPTERGPYNLDIDGMDENGYLKNPKDRWGGIMRKLDNTDFETSNIEYIEFWMMDPFIYDKDGTNKGGELYFNLGDISEDVLKDGKKAFEHGLPIDGNDNSKTETTIWGRVPKTQSTITAFDNTEGARKNQDVGLDGLSTDNESLFPTYSDYVQNVRTKINNAALQRMEADKFSPINDPAGDNYQFYKSTDYDDASADILTRYKRYNGTEGNSPDANNTNEEYTTTATSLPDIEDVNSDNTLNEYEKYFQYRVAIKRDSMQVGRNHIADSYTSTVELENGTSESVTWYQFKIPIREYNDQIGSIRNFKSIRFIRMFMTNFEKEAHLRFATLDLVRGEWRTYNKDLYTLDKLPVSKGALDVQAVNIEENSDKTPVNYVLPPGVTREIDPGQAQVLTLNEQSMVMKVNELSPNDARAVYKNTSYDMRKYKRLQMFVHAENLPDAIRNLKDYELTCFIRLGSDMVNNYYEYEIPLKLTPEGVYSGESDSDREIVWPEENMFDFPFSVLTEKKLLRNKSKQDGSFVSDLIPFYDKGKNKIRVVGNPSISEVENIMIGIRNISGEIQSGEIWVNELRMSEFDESGGWAAMGNLALGLSDIGNVNVSGRVETAGYGSIESNVMDRRNDDLYQMNFSTNMELGRFLPEKAKIQLPAYFSYTNETITPKYNPLDEDILLDDALSIIDNKADRDTLMMNSQTVSESKSFNISSAKVNIKSKKPQFYDPANVTFTYSYSERNQTSAEVERNLEKQERAAVNYNYSFNSQPVEPFKKIKAFKKPAYKIISDFNFNYLPSSISFNSDMNRLFSQVKLRDLTQVGNSGNFDLNFSKDFMWNRNFDIKFDLTKALRFSLQTAMNANIEESYLTPEIGKEYYEEWRDSVWSSIRKLGTPYTYQQVFSASWTLPINKIPIFDWITANASYNSTYSWNRSAKLASTTTTDGLNVGNVASSMGAWSADGQFNFETLYNKSKYLKEVNRKFSVQQQSNNQKFQPKTYKQVVKLEKDKKLTVNHRLGSEKFSFIAADKNGKPVQLSFKSINATTLEITPKFNADSVSLSLVTLDPNNQSSVKDAVDFTARLLMMTRRVSFTFRKSSSMVLPTFMKEPGFLGQEKVGDMMAPGYAFTFGMFDENTVEEMYDKGWLYRSDSLVSPVSTAYTSDLDIKASLEPIPGFKIDLNAKRYTADNTSIYLTNGMPKTFTGSYNITQIAILTMFMKTANAEKNYASEVFDRFLSNRQVIANRLNAKYRTSKYPKTGFFKELPTLAGDDFNEAYGILGLNSTDVLIPAFLAAYTGRDANTVDTNPFLSFLSILPNWRLNYDGLSRIPWIKDNFKSISLTHAYTCRYSIGNYTSYSTWVAMEGEDDSALGFVRSNDDNPIPSSAFSISSVTLSEQFSPLIGINAALKNSMTAKVEYRKQRNLSLNPTSTQLIEASSDEFVVGMGYLIKDFDVILKMKNDQQSRIKNDLKLSADLSYKDIKTLLRKINEDLTQASSGNKVFTLKIIADYVFSSKVNIQMFFDRQATTPLISSTYPVSSTNFGVSFKFMLTR